MTIRVTEIMIGAAERRTIKCPVYLALLAAGYDVSFVNVTDEAETWPVFNFYHTHKGEALIQPLPATVGHLIQAYDRTGKMEPFEFELPPLV